MKFYKLKSDYRTEYFVFIKKPGGDFIELVFTKSHESFNISKSVNLTGEVPQDIMEIYNVKEISQSRFLRHAAFVFFDLTAIMEVFVPFSNKTKPLKKMKTLISRLKSRYNQRKFEKKAKNCAAVINQLILNTERLKTQCDQTERNDKYLKELTESMIRYQADIKDAKGFYAAITRVFIKWTLKRYGKTIV